MRMGTISRVRRCTFVLCLLLLWAWTCESVYSQAPATTPVNLQDLRQSAIEKLKATLPEITNWDLREDIYRRIAVDLGYADPRLAFNAAGMVFDYHDCKLCFVRATAAWAESDFESAYKAVLNLEEPVARFSALAGLLWRGELDSVLPLISKVQGIEHWDYMRALLVERLATAGRITEAEDMLARIEHEEYIDRAAADILAHNDGLSLKETRERIDEIGNPFVKLDLLRRLSEKEESAVTRNEIALAFAEAAREAISSEGVPHVYDQFGTWANDRPQATLNLLNEISVPDTCRQRLILEIMSRWAFTYPIAAAREAAKLGEDEEREYAEAGIILGRAVRSERLDSYLFKDIENSEARQWAKRRFVERMAREQFESALAVAADIGDTDHRDKLLSTLAELVAADDLDKALIAVDRMGDPGSRAAKLHLLCHFQSQHYPERKPVLSAACARVLAEIRRLPTGMPRTWFLGTMGCGWAACDPVAARQVLDEIPEWTADDEFPNALGSKINLLQDLAKYGSEQDPQGTYDWALAYDGSPVEKAALWIGVAEGLTPAPKTSAESDAPQTLNRSPATDN